MNRLSRRTLLRGLFGGTAIAIGLPALEMFLNVNGDAWANGDAFPARFGLFFWGNGNLPELWNPKKTGFGDAWKLTDQLSALGGTDDFGSVKDQVTVVTGMEVKASNLEPHLSGAAGILSGQDLIGTGDVSTFAGPSIDQIIAQQIGSDTRFRSLEFGAAAREGLSYNGPNSRNPPETDPYKLFLRIFSQEQGFTKPGDDPIIDPRWALRRSILDSVMDDAAALRQRVGSADRQRLDAHLQGIRELETRLARLEESPPDLKACTLLPPDKEPLTEYPVDETGRPQLSAINRAMCDTIAMAMACDQVRVVSNFFTYPVSNDVYPGVSEGHHNLTHDEPTPQPEVNEIVKQIITEYAYMVHSLKAIEEGDGTLLDNCAILGTTDVSLGKTHAQTDFPILIAGSACGRLKQGWHFNYTDNPNASTAMLSIVRAMGISAPSYGAGKVQATEGLSDIEA